MHVDLAYGKKGLRIHIPDQHHVDVIEPRYVEGLPNQRDAVSKVLFDPISHRSLQESVRSDHRVAIIFSDITRATPYQILVPALLKALEHVPDHNIAFFCATGTHRQATKKELYAILGKEIVDRYKIVQNDATKKELFQYVGTTKAGNTILLNKEILEYDLRVLTGFIEPHFFAGFSGGGTIVIAAECRDGIPSGSDYEKILNSTGSVPALMDFVRKNETVYKDTWQVYFQVMIQEKSDVYLYSTRNDATVERALLKPAGNLDQLLLKLIENYGKESRICVLPEGPQTIPFLNTNDES